MIGKSSYKGIKIEYGLNNSCNKIYKIIKTSDMGQLMQQYRFYLLRRQMIDSSNR